MKSHDALLTPREAAATIGVSYPAIKQWILAGKLRTIKTPGGHHRIPQDALKRYLPAPAKPPSTASRERFRQVSGRNQLIGTIVVVKISGLLAKIEDAGRRLLEFPMAGPSREQFAAGLRVTFEGNYAIYYTSTATELVIIRVLHGARDAAALADRGGFV